MATDWSKHRDRFGVANIATNEVGKVLCPVGTELTGQRT